MNSTIFYDRNSPRHNWQLVVEARRSYTDEELHAIARDRLAWAGERGYPHYQLAIICQPDDADLACQLPRDAGVRVLFS